MSKHTVRVLLLLLLIVLVIWWLRSRRPPDNRVALHMSAICDIAEAGESSPSRGVDHLFAYLADNSPAMLSDVGETLVEIESIPSDEEHDARARLAASRLREPLHRCAESLRRFGEAIPRPAPSSNTVSPDFPGRSRSCWAPRAGRSSLRTCAAEL
jgi:hypothetical protein